MINNSSEDQVDGLKEKLDTYLDEKLENIVNCNLISPQELPRQRQLY